MSYVNKKNNNKALIDSYIIIEEIGSGSFGDVYIAKSKKTDSMVAVKVESKKDNSRIINEYKVYKRLNKLGFTKGIPQVYDLIQTSNYNIMCMELLGPSLEDVYNNHNRKFEPITILKLGIDMVNLLEKMHNTGFIHRDIKPNNFLIGKDEDKNKLYIMDFGLSKRYMVKGKHIKMQEGKSLIGTARYASINMHMGIEPSRRDDLESVGYMLIYFFLPKLPWQGLKKQKNANHIKIIGEKKICTNLNTLCENVPNCFKEYIIYCRGLKFDETPDYSYLKELFINECIKINKVPQYEWVN